MKKKNNIFCSNHSKKFAKKHCNKCNVDLCNECALDLHISHYQSLKKLENNAKNKVLDFSHFLREEIKNIIDNSLQDISSQIMINIQEKAVKMLEEYKNEIAKDEKIEGQKTDKCEESQSGSSSGDEESNPKEEKEEKKDDDKKVVPEEKKETQNNKEKK